MQSNILLSSEKKRDMIKKFHKYYNNNKQFGTSLSSYHSLSFSFSTLRVYR